jgi:chemotaxis protein methyltransferase CheR
MRGEGEEPYMQLQTEYHIDEEDFHLLRDVVYKHCGISLSAEKKSLVQARITKLMRIGGFASCKEYLKRVFSDRAGLFFSEFIDAISTNLTSFFRENQHYKYLSETVLPEILTRKQQAGDARILAWSAACSSGEEPYTLAITILEAILALPTTRIQWDVRILATDISTKMLGIARAGMYDAARLAAVPPMYRSYFAEVHGDTGTQRFAVSPDIRDIVRFRHLNLIDAWPFKGPFDFIFCRNVMIYFDQPTQQKLVERYWNCLAPGGFLFTGHSESLTGIAHRFINRKPSIYEKPPV